MKAVTRLPGEVGGRKYATLLFAALALCALYLTSLYSYLLFHGFAELFSIVVASAIFLFVWNTRRNIDNHYLLLIGVAYLFVGALDLVHTLAYPGMGIFEGRGTNEAAQLWISARYIESLSLLIAPLFISRKLNPSFVFGGYLLVTSLLLASIFYWNVFPDCFVEGTGLTLFKKTSEYVISAILLTSAYLLFRKRAEFDKGVFQLLIASIIVTVASEISFTLYTDAFGLPNLIGHLLKIISFYLIYRAIIVTGLVHPYDLLFRKLKQSEVALRESEEHYSTLVQNIADAVLQFKQGVVTWCNESAETLYGFARDELIGKPASFFYPEHVSAPDFTREVSRAIADRGVFTDTTTFRRKDGSEAEIEYAISPIPNTVPVELVAVARDVTERKRIEEALREQRHSLAERLKELRCLYGTSDLWGKEGLQLEQILQGIVDLIPPAWQYPEITCARIILEGQEFRTRNFRETVWKQASGIIVHGERIGAVEVCYLEARPEMDDGPFLRDERSVLNAIAEQSGRMIERRRMEHAVRQSEEKYRQLVENLQEGIWVIDRDARTTFVNARMAEMLGYTVDEMQGKHLFTFMDERGVGLAKRHLERRQQGIMERHDFEFLRKDGGRVFASLETSPIVDDDGNYMGALAGVQDITDRRRAEEALRRERDNLFSIMEAMEDGVYICSQQYDIEYVNPSLVKEFGPIDGRKCYNYFHDLEEPCPWCRNEDVFSGKTDRWEFRFARSERTYDLIETPVHNPDGSLSKLAILRDVTERRKLDQLKDEFIGMVSHELRTPLTVVIGAVSTALSEDERLSPEERRQLLGDAASEAETLSHLLGNLLELSRVQADRLVLHIEPTNIRRVIQNTVGKLRQQYPTNRFAVDMPKQLPMVPGDELRVERILYNLLENAAKYSPQGGRIRVFAREENGSLVIGVSDQGIGISAEDQARIFAPFQRLEDTRTDAVGGIGLGLLVCRRLVEAHRGQIWVESEPGRGSTFFFTLPFEPEVI